jgi:hypothetical protein
MLILRKGWCVDGARAWVLQVAIAQPGAVTKNGERGLIRDRSPMRGLSTLIVVLLPVGNPLAAQSAPGPVGVVSRINVVSDKVPDVSSMDAWKKSFIKEGMSDAEKALAVWRSTVMFQHQDAPPYEHLQNEQVVQDPIKIFNVYGYSFCSVASSEIAALARHAGLKTRGWAINGHSVPEVHWDGAWHMLDASLINYFPKADGSPAGVEEILGRVGPVGRVGGALLDSGMRT